MTYGAHDALTGMATKAPEDGRYEARINVGKTTGVVRLMMVSKLISITLGHEAGDKLLEDFAAHVSSV